jgi:hypothetical protein
MHQEKFIKKEYDFLISYFATPKNSSSQFYAQGVFYNIDAIVCQNIYLDYIASTLVIKALITIGCAIFN